MPYFDHNATTPLDPRVHEAMTPWLGSHHGNPSSAHRFGREARTAIETARAQIATLLDARATDIVFTGSGTEANNAVIATAAATARHRGRIVVASFEHPSIHAGADLAARAGMTVDRVAPDADGVIDPAVMAGAFRDDTRLACLMLANNELGTVQPVAAVAAQARRRAIPVLCDAVQAAGKIPVRVAALGVDYLVIGGHKFHGPLGAAALWIRPGAALAPLLVGGGQEGGHRAGTENVPAIVGLGQAAALAHAELDDRQRHLETLRQRLEAGLAAIPGTRLHCTGAPRVPHTTHVAFEGRSGHRLVLALDEAGFAVSTGAACHAGQPRPSAVLLAMGLSAQEALSSLRISIGMTNTADEVDALLDALRERLTTSAPRG